MHAIMTGSFSWSLLLVALLLPLSIAPAYRQHTEDYRLTFILAIKNNDSGLEVYTLFPENRGSIDVEHELDPRMHVFFPGRNLSSWCGDQYFRCQELLVETLFLQDDGIKLNVVFVPLENGVLLLSNWYDLNTTSMEWSHFIVNSSNCSPTVLYKVSENFYTMLCISSTDHYVAVYEVHLNLSRPMIENATLVGPLTQINIPNSLSTSRLSNFILVEQMVYFAVGNTIFVTDVFDSIATQTQYPELSTCTQIHKLVPIIDDRNQQLLVAYCTDRYSYFDPVYGDWTTIRTFSMYGVPYICPSDDYKVTLFINSTNEGHYLQFSVHSSSPNITRNVNISSGICFKYQNRTYFAYSDQQHNSVFVYNFIKKNRYPVSPYDCLDCPQLLLLGDQYLIVHDANHDLVLDTKTNFSLIINISSGIPDILAILHSNITIHNVITPSPPTIHSTTTGKVPPGINVTSTLIYTHAYSTTTAKVSPGINVTSTLISTQAYNTTTAKVSPGMNVTSTLISAQTYTYTTTVLPLVTIHTTITATVSPGAYSYSIIPTYTKSATSLLSPFTDNTVTASPTVAPTHVSIPQSNLLGTILTVVIGLFVIMVILVTVAVAFSIRHRRGKR